MNNLAVSYSNLGQMKEAAQLHEETLEIRRRALGFEHPDTLWSTNNLAMSYSNLGRTTEATQLRGDPGDLKAD
jgi:Tetratricopeptide repeat